MIALVMGSDSDLPVMSKAAEVLEKFGLPYKLTIASAHRTPERVQEFVKKVETEGIKVIIAGAGGAAHLPGVIAALTHLPVIGVPIKSAFLDGLDSLLSIVQMPTGIPVATVGINSAENAALLALTILSILDEEVAKKLKEYRKQLKEKVEEKSKQVETLGYKAYLAGKEA